ncbi:MAG: hypothetical protein WCK49_05290 [Myxococcaceae bacterium]
MKKKIMLALVITSTTLAAVGLLPPKYLNVPDFQDCLKTESMGTWEHWCMPHQKPTNCAEHSWEELTQLTGRDRPADCRH